MKPRKKGKPIKRPKRQPIKRTVRIIGHVLDWTIGLLAAILIVAVGLCLGWLERRLTRPEQADR